MKGDRCLVVLFFFRIAAVILLIALAVWWAKATEWTTDQAGVTGRTSDTADVLEEPATVKARPVVVSKNVEKTGSATQVKPKTTLAPIRYELTAAERDLVERVVMAESGGEGYDGMRLVAQCILNGCERSGLRPSSLIQTYGYTSARKAPSEDCKRAVTAVFDRGDTYTDEVIEVFYAPAICRSAWHESQTFVLEYGGHRFFRMR